MDTLTAARAQMEVSLGFHMVFAALGIALPLLLVIVEGLWLRTGQRHYLDLAHQWGKATALLFAIGAVSGTALSFELGLLWPRFMEFAGGIIGPGFALEGYAFFIEAIFIGLYLYGWERLSPMVHWLTGLPIALSGLASGVLVLAINAWMQVPGGFEVADGKPVNIDPTAPFRNPAWVPMAIHAALACYIAVGFAVAGVYALGALRGRRDAYHRVALKVSLALATVTAVLQPLSGDQNARNLTSHQPVKLAAMEAHFRTQAGAPLLIGGLADTETGEVRGAIRIPRALSLLAAHDPEAVVRGLDDFDRELWPNVALTHLAFDLMVACGFALVGLGLWFWWSSWRAGALENRWLLRALVVGSPLGFIALEAGWVVTEAGRQPWTIYGHMLTRQAVTPAAHVTLSFYAFTLLYLALGSALVLLLRRLAKAGRPSVQSGAGKESRDGL